MKQESQSFLKAAEEDRAFYCPRKISTGGLEGNLLAGKGLARHQKTRKISDHKRGGKRSLRGGRGGLCLQRTTNGGGRKRPYRERL